LIIALNARCSFEHDVYLFVFFTDTSLSSQPFDPVQFRLLLHQRMLELHKDKFSMLPFLGHQAHGTEEGLDLTVSSNASRAQSDNDDDFFEEGDEDDEDNEVCENFKYSEKNFFMGV